MKRRVVQRHHISRFNKELGTPEIVAHIFRFEHELLTKMDRMLKSKCSATFTSEMWKKVLSLKIQYSEDDMRELWEENQKLRRNRPKSFKKKGVNSKL